MELNRWFYDDDDGDEEEWKTPEESKVGRWMGENRHPHIFTKAFREGFES